MRKMLLLYLLLFMPLCCVFAQEQSNEDVNGIDLSHMAVVATVNIYDAQIVSQEEGDFVLSFDLSNREYVQPDIRYGVQLIKAEENGSQMIVDEFVFDENVALDEHQMIKREVKYTAPDYLNGDFQLWIMAKNQAGLTLALANLGDVSLVGGGQSVEIDETSCFMQVNDHATHYSLFQGVDIAQNEKISVVCDVNNRSNEKIKIKPQTQTFWRSTFGKSVDTERMIYEEQGLDPLAKKQISIVLPKPTVPQAYDVRIFFESEKGQMISNLVTVHYVLGGNSATIQNVRLDKNYYKKGENAKVSFFWSGAASNFMGARTAQDREADLSVHISVSDRDGVSCIADFTQKIDPTVTRPDLSLPVVKDCVDPHVVVEIRDAQDGVLDTRTYNLMSDVPQSELKKQESRPLIFYGSIFIGVLFAISLLIIAIKYKKGTMSAVLFMIFLPGIFLCGHMDVWADTFAGTYGARAQYPYLPYPTYAPHDYTVTANLNKSVYMPGESITGSITGITHSCINTLMDYSLIINIKGSNNAVDGSRNLGIEPKTHSVNTTAPTVPGMYNAYFTLRDNRCFPGVGICRFTSNNDLWLYLANKTAQVNSQNYEGRSNWSEDEVRQRIEAVSGTIYQHFLNFNASAQLSTASTALVMAS